MNAENPDNVVPLQPTQQDLDDIAAMNAEDVAFEPVGRNQPCPCGSGKKYKVCHGSAEARQEQVIAEKATFVPVLKAWREALKPAAKDATARIEPSWASRICAQYPQLTFGDMVEFRSRYFGKIAALQAILDAEIDTDEECLNTTSPEEDVAQNAMHYKNLLTDWQLQFVEWEMAWDCADPGAAAELAAMSEVHKMFLSQEGLVAW